MSDDRPPIFDYGKQSRKHLKMMLKNALHRWGLPAMIYDKKLFNNDYQNVYPEFTQEIVPGGTCLVLLGQPISGLNLSNFISLSDKVETNMRVTTDKKLEIGQQLEITFTDGKKLNLRITANLAFHVLSTVGYNYDAVVT